MSLTSFAQTSHFVKSGQSDKHLLSTYCGHASSAESLDLSRKDRHLAHVLHFLCPPLLSSVPPETAFSRLPCLPGRFSQGRHRQRLADGEGKSPCLFLHHVTSLSVNFSAMTSAPTKGSPSLCAPCCAQPRTWALIALHSPSLAPAKDRISFLVLLIPGFVTVSCLTPQLSQPCITNSPY